MLLAPHRRFLPAAGRFRTRVFVFDRSWRIVWEGIVFGDANSKRVALNALTRAYAQGEDMAYKVALAQITPILGEVRRNVEIHEEAIRRAAQSGARLVVFPELSLTGYHLQDLTAEVALARDGEVLNRLAAFAAEVGVDAVVGFPERSPEFFYHVAAAYLSAGKVVAVHRKVYLPTYGMFDESRYFRAGDAARAFPTQFGPAGVLICEDAWHPTLPYLLALDGAQTLIIVSSGPGRGVVGPALASAETWELILRTYAQLFGVYVLFANRAGFEDGVGFWGGSAVVDPRGRVVSQGAIYEDDLVLAEVNVDLVGQARLASPLLAAERPEIAMKELARILRGRGWPW